MGWRKKVPVLVAVSCLVMWHGILQAVPHVHESPEVSQERLSCWASHPLSQEQHLHGSGESVHHLSCLACLAGTTVGWVPGDVGATMTENGSRTRPGAPAITGVVAGTRRPCPRGPPTAV